MAIKNLELNIKRPTEQLGDAITFTSVDDDEDQLRIPRRYPFKDIANIVQLVKDGYFRHVKLNDDEDAVDDGYQVSSELNGSSDTNTEGKLGFELPNTEKLILLVKRTGVASDGTGEEKFTIHGSDQYNIDDFTKTWAADDTFTSGTKIYEVSLYDFGLFIAGVTGEDGIMIDVTDKTLEFALIARMG